MEYVKTNWRELVEEVEYIDGTSHKIRRPGEIQVLYYIGLRHMYYVHAHVSIDKGRAIFEIRLLRTNNDATTFRLMGPVRSAEVLQLVTLELNKNTF